MGGRHCCQPLACYCPLTCACHGILLPPQEGTNINVSLLMLGTVVSRLAEGRRGDFIPYRNSKLTRLLQPCLGGNARTAIVAVMNPSHVHVEETFNTLLFAQRAMAVMNQVQARAQGSMSVVGFRVACQ